MNGADRPNIGARGGELLGIPVLTSRFAPPGIVLVDPGLVAVVEGEADVKTSRHGSVQMDDAPTGSSVAPTANNMVSMWQVNAIGIAVMMRVNWAARAGAVSMLAGS